MSELIGSNKYTCPLCSKLIIDHEIFNTRMQGVIESFPIPEEYKDKEVNILCNECGNKSITLWHFIGHKCDSCGSYNTNIM
jgi:predicted RNA-binding Zn-ribbon protein involved in translation (DUF1610 family)